VIATVCWGSYAVLSLPLLRRHPPLVVAAYTMLFGGLAAAPFALPGFVSAEWGEVSREAWEAVAYSTLLVAAFCFYAWQRGGLSGGGQPGFGLPVPDHPGGCRLGGGAAR
jgi:drug/metabolite transporter (DMT)-like permease